MSIAMAEEVVSEVTEQVAGVAEKAAEGRMTLDIGNNLLYAILGYLVVFIGLSLLMIVIVIVGKIMVAKLKAAKAPKVLKARAIIRQLSCRPSAPPRWKMSKQSPLTALTSSTAPSPSPRW